jgi:heme exporter protein C
MSPKHRALFFLDGISVLLILTAVYLVFFYAPVEAVMGQVQKVFYFHVATAWVGMLGFLAAAGAGIFYLIKSDLRWDIVGVSAVEISLVFFFTAIVTGSIWARPTWNTWWTWDPRLTTAAVVELIYLAYFLLRQGVDDQRKRARFSAVYAIFGALSVPLTFISIRLLRTIHPVVVGGGAGTGSGGFNMIPSMQVTFFFSLFAFSVFFADLLWHRIRLEQAARQIQTFRENQWDQIGSEG